MSNPVTNVSKTELFEIVSKITGTSVDDVFLDTSVVNICKGNVYKLGLILFDLHELTEKQVDYLEEEIVNKFKTIQDIAEYFELI